MSNEMILLICLNVLFGWAQMAWGWYRGYKWGKREMNRQWEETLKRAIKVVQRDDIVTLVRADR